MLCLHHGQLNDAGQHYHVFAGRGHLTTHHPNMNSVRNLHSLFCIESHAVTVWVCSYLEPISGTALPGGGRCQSA